MKIKIISMILIIIILFIVCLCACTSNQNNEQPKDMTIEEVSAKVRERYFDENGKARYFIVWEDCYKTVTGFTVESVKTLRGGEWYFIEFTPYGIGYFACSKSDFDYRVGIERGLSLFRKYNIKQENRYIDWPAQRYALYSYVKIGDNIYSLVGIDRLVSNPQNTTTVRVIKENREEESLKIKIPQEIYSASKFALYSIILMQMYAVYQYYM